jgi:hypothetical protein
MKLPYDQVTILVDKLYRKEFPKGTPNKEVEDYCEFIAQTIESMGWDVDDYTVEYLKHGLPDLNPPKIDPKAN